MKNALNTAALGLAGLGLGIAANMLPAASASGASLELTKARLALLLAIGLWTRALSAGLAGALADRFGARRTLRDACAGAAAAGLGLGLLLLTGREGTLFVGVAILHAGAAYFWSFAGPAAARVNAARMEPAQRGLHAGLYGAIAFPAEFIVLPLSLWLVARVPPSALYGLPAAAALLALAAARRAPAAARDEDPRGGPAALRALVREPAAWALAALEACAGAVRWGVLGWSAQFLSEVHDIRPGGPLFGSALAAAALGAAAGPLLCGWLSDRSFGARRGPAALTFFAAQACALAALGHVAEPSQAIAMLGLVCAAAFGVHSLLSGAAAMDLGGPRSAGSVSGALYGVHHAAGGLSVLYVGGLVNRGGWGAWTDALIPFSVAGAALSLLLRFKAFSPERA